MAEPIVALDARLVGGTSTGDSTYWTGLLHGLSDLRPAGRFLLYTNAERPPAIPLPVNFSWICRPARMSRWWSAVLFPVLARREGATAIHTQYSLSPLAGSVGITTIHDVSFFIGPEWFRPRDLAILTRTVPASVRRARRVLAVSKTSQAEIERFIPEAKGKTTVTPNACPPWIQAVDPDAARAQVQNELGIQDPYVLTVGTRWPRKNMDLAVAATSLLPERVPHRLVVTGKTGWGSQELGPRGVASGYVSNETLSALYSAADLYLAPSRHEGFGIPLLEAFRCGCPVLCSSGGALPKVAGDAARIMPSWEPSDWAQAMQELLEDSGKLSSLRERGREREKTFSWSETARRTLEVYRGTDADPRP